MGLVSPNKHKQINKIEQSPKFLHSLDQDESISQTEQCTSQKKRPRITNNAIFHGYKRDMTPNPGLQRLRSCNEETMDSKTFREQRSQQQHDPTGKKSSNLTSLMSPRGTVHQLMALSGTQTPL